MYIYNFQNKNSSINRTVNSGPNGVLTTEANLYRTVNSGPNGVLTTEVSLYRIVNSGPNGVLTIQRFLCIGQLTVV